jgi:hypothetical protein
MTATITAGDTRSTFVSDWLATGFAVALSDGLFASATGLFVPPTVTPFRVFRGVASVAFGPDVIKGGVPWALVGICMHICVALFWSGLFVAALYTFPRMRSMIRTLPGAFAIAIPYGMSIWLFMSLVFIPSMLHRAPTITPKWWVQLIGHIPFVVGPMILVNRRRQASLNIEGI